MERSTRKYDKILRELTEEEREMFLSELGMMLPTRARSLFIKLFDYLEASHPKADERSLGKD